MTNDKKHLNQLAGKVEYLKPIRRKPKKINFSVYDIEATSWVNHLLSGYYDGDKVTYFTCVSDFIKFVDGIFDDEIIYCHNGGRYDFRFLMSEIKKSNVGMLDIAGNIATISYVNSVGAKIDFRDSLFILPMSLKKLGASMGVEVTKGEIDYNRMELNDELYEYLRRDLISHYQIISKFQEKIIEIGGELKLTIGATALDLYRRKYLKYPLISYFPQDSVLRNGYYGGRVECNIRIGENLKYYDYNSLYPSVMQTNKFPIGLPTFYNCEVEINDADCGIALISTYIPKSLIPLLPVRMEIKKQKMLVFPHGNIKGYYPLPFLKKLRDMGIEYKTHEAYLFDSDYLFKDWVSDLYQMRLDYKGDAMATIVKLILNNLYGKFAQGSEKKSLHLNPTQEFIIENSLREFHSGDTYDIWEQSYNLYSSHTLVAISAYVTAFGQIKLYEALESVGNDAWYYCDTDSIFTSAELPTSEKLGDLKLECDIKEAAFLGNKMYSYISDSGEVVIKYRGYPRELLNIRDSNNAINEQKTQDLKLKFHTEMKKSVVSGKYKFFSVEYEKLWGMREGFKRQDGVTHEGNDFLKFGERKKSLHRVDTKRIFRGIKTIPFYLNQAGEIKNEENT